MEESLADEGRTGVDGGDEGRTGGGDRARCPGASSRPAAARTKPVMQM